MSVLNGVGLQCDAGKTYRCFKCMPANANTTAVNIFQSAEAR